MPDEAKQPSFHSIEVWFAKGAKPENCYRAFEAFGYAMTAASSFEMLMAMLASKTMIFRLGKRAGTSDPIDEAVIRRQMLTYSYAKLQQWIKRLHDLSPELSEGLELGKTTRDSLAHDFWATHARDLYSEEGVDVIATHCASAADYFSRLATSLTLELKIDAAEFLETLHKDEDREQRLAGWHEVFVEEGLR